MDALVRPVVHLERVVVVIDAHVFRVVFGDLLAQHLCFIGAVRALEITKDGDHDRGALLAEGRPAHVVDLVEVALERVLGDVVALTFDDGLAVLRNEIGTLLAAVSLAGL